MPNPTTQQMPQPALPDDKKALGGDATRREQPPGSIPPELADTIGRSMGQNAGYDADIGRTVVPVVLVKDITKEGEVTGPPYRVVVLDLSVARDHQPIQQTIDLVMSGVTFASQVAGGSFRLHIGDREGILFGGSGLPLGSAIDFESNEQTRLLLTNTAQAGASAELVVNIGRRSV